MPTLFWIGLENAVVVALLGVAACLLGPCFRRRAAARHLLWLIVLLKLVTPPLWRLPILPAAEKPAEASAPFALTTIVAPQIACLEPLEDDAISVMLGEGESHEDAFVELSEPTPLPVVWARTEPRVVVSLDRVPASLWNEPLLRWAAWAWGLGSLGVLFISILRIRRFQALVGLVKPATEGVEDLVIETARRLGLRRLPVVGMTQGEVSPMVWSLGLRSVLILPGNLWKRLDATQQATLVAHELAHLRRGDHYVRWLELLATVLFWWHPVVWWSRRALREAEEQCCDAWVVWAYPAHARAYAETLMETVGFLSNRSAPIPAFASGAGHFSQLKRRLVMIMKGKTTRTLGFGGGLAAFALSAMLLPVTPSWAQKPREEKQVEEKKVIIVQGKPDSEKHEVEIVELKGSEDADPFAGKGEKQVRIVVKSVDGELSTDGNVFAFAAAGDGAMKAAVDKLAAELKELEGKKDKSKSDEAHIAAYKKALEALKKAAAATGGNEHGLQHVIINRSEAKSESKDKGDQVKEEAKTSAEKDELRAVIKKLQAEATQSGEKMRDISRQMAETHKKLAEATRKLAELEGGNVFRFRAVQPTRPGMMEGFMNSRSRATAPPAMTLEPFPARIPAPASSNQNQRIEELEKKLERVLDQLESMKKEKAEHR